MLGFEVEVGKAIFPLTITINVMPTNWYSLITVPAEAEKDHKVY